MFWKNNQFSLDNNFIGMYTNVCWEIVSKFKIIEYKS